MWGMVATLSPGSALHTPTPSSFAQLHPHTSAAHMMAASFDLHGTTTVSWSGCVTLAAAG